MLSSSTVCLSWFGDHVWRVRSVLGAGGGGDAGAQRRKERKRRWVKYDLPVSVFKELINLKRRQMGKQIPLIASGQNWEGGMHNPQGKCKGVVMWLWWVFWMIKGVWVYFSLWFLGETVNSYETTCTLSFRLVNELIKYFIVVYFLETNNKTSR